MEKGLAMSRKETKGAVLIVIGLIIMTISVLDIISVIASVLNTFLNLKLPDVLFNSFVFRISVVLIGGLITIAGAFIYRKK